MNDAAYARTGHGIAAPLSLRLECGAFASVVRSNAREAEATAMMAAALLRPSAGSVLIGEYDTRVQPAHCKRIAALVPHDPLPLSRIDARRYMAYRAALWGLDVQQAERRFTDLLERLGGVHEAFAYPVAAALLPDPQLLVLDRPQPELIDRARDAAGTRAVLVVSAP
jgi:ABC-type Na+ transport system ATPase subunit NatA